MTRHPSITTNRVRNRTLGCTTIVAPHCRTVRPSFINGSISAMKIFNTLAAPDPAHCTRMPEVDQTDRLPKLHPAHDLVAAWPRIVRCPAWRTMTSQYAGTQFAWANHLRSCRALGVHPGKRTGVLRAWGDNRTVWRLTGPAGSKQHTPSWLDSLLEQLLTVSYTKSSKTASLDAGQEGRTGACGGRLRLNLLYMNFFNETDPTYSAAAHRRQLAGSLFKWPLGR